MKNNITNTTTINTMSNNTTIQSELSSYLSDKAVLNNRRERLFRGFKNRIKSNDGNVVWVVAISNKYCVGHFPVYYYFKTQETAEAFISHCKRAAAECESDDNYTGEYKNQRISLDVSIASQLTDAYLRPSIRLILGEDDFDKDNISVKSFYAEHNDWTH